MIITNRQAMLVIENLKKSKFPNCQTLGTRLQTTLTLAVQNKQTEFEIADSIVRDFNLEKRLDMATNIYQERQTRPRFRSQKIRSQIHQNHIAELMACSA